MEWIQSLIIALNMLRQHKLRALLTMLGVIIGVMSVTTIVMLSEGFKEYLNSEFSKIGSSTIFVTYDRSRLRQGELTGAISGLEEEDVTYLRERCTLVDLVAGYREIGQRTIRAGEREAKSISIRAIDENFIQLNRLELLRGRLISRQDTDLAANVAILSNQTAKLLFPTGDPLGQYVRLPGIELQVVGITEDMTMLGTRDVNALFMPLKTANKKWLGGEDLDVILLRAREGVKPQDAMQQVWEALMAKSGGRVVYRVDSVETILNVVQSVIAVAGALLAGIAGLSLLVGGIGIMNIMLVSVTERTHEIGLRKAVGAKNSSILAQFLIEAATLSLIGGLMGMFLAYWLGQIVMVVSIEKAWPTKTGITTPFPLSAGIVSLIYSAMVGIIFGLFPAISAARLDPIEALRRV